ERGGYSLRAPRCRKASLLQAASQGWIIQCAGRPLDGRICAIRKLGGCGRRSGRLSFSRPEFKWRYKAMNRQRPTVVLVMAIVNIVLSVAGIGLLQMKSWARWTCVAYGVYGVVASLAGLVYTIAVVNPRWRNGNKNRWPVPGETPGSTTPCPSSLPFSAWPTP